MSPKNSPRNLELKQQIFMSKKILICGNRMKAEDVKSIAVLGAGTMGHGIAEVAALSGYDVNMRDIDEKPLEDGMNRIKWSLNKFVEKGKITDEEAKTATERIETFIDLDDSLSGVDLVIEAAPENMELKKQIFSDLNDLCPEKTILATNTSGLSITEMAEETDRPEKVAGMHWFNPPPLMDLIELIKGEETSDETIEILEEVSKKMGKTPIVVKRDISGFVVNNVLGEFMGEAERIIDRGEATEKEINSAVVFKEGFPMGPTEMYELFFTGKRPERDYTEEDGKEFDPTPIFAQITNMASSLLNKDVISAEDLDTGMKLGTNWPKGPLEWADETGIDNVVEKLEEMKDEFGDDRYEPNPFLKKKVEENKTGKETGEGFYRY